MNLIRPLHIAVVMLLVLSLSSCRGEGDPPQFHDTGSEVPTKIVGLQKPAAPAFTASDILGTLGPPAPFGYDMYAVRVGTSKSAKKRLFVLGADPKERISISFSFFVLQGGGRIILIDTGTVNQKKIRQWKMDDYRSPEKGLALLGIVADQVTDIVITHRHWDHIGGLSLFKKAQVWMAEKEYEDALKRYGKKDPALHRVLVELKGSGRLQFTGNLQRLFPGVAVVRQGRHTRHYQYVAVNGGSGLWLFAVDETPLYENLITKTPTGQTKDPALSAKAMNTLLELAGGDVEYIVPGHDPSLYEKFPEVAPGVVRLDKTHITKMPDQKR